MIINKIFLKDSWTLLGIPDCKPVRMADRQTCGRAMGSQAKRFLFESGIARNDQEST